MNALDPTVAEFRERLKHERTEKRRRLNAMIDGATDDQVRGLLERHKASQNGALRSLGELAGRSVPSRGRAREIG